MPKCILEFEIDILRKGLELLPLGENIGLTFLVDGIKGAVQFMLGNPNLLIESIITTAR